MAIVKLSADGQEIPVPDDVARTDASLKAALTPFYPEMANAIISRSTDAAGQMVVTLTKQAGTKGSGQAPAESEPETNPVLDYLGQARQEINPALRVAWKLQLMMATDQMELEKLITLQPQIEAAVAQGEADQTRIVQIYQTIRDIAPTPAQVPNIPFGF